MKKVLMILAENPFRDPEYFIPKQILEDNNIGVTTASTSDVAHGAEGADVEVDELLKDVNPKEFDAVVFIGGKGSKQYYDDQTAHELARFGAKPGKVLGAICASVGTPAKAGVLKGKRVTSDPAVADVVKEGGVIYTGEGVTVDGNIVTADGVRSAKAFGEALVKALSAI